MQSEFGRIGFHSNNNKEKKKMLFEVPFHNVIILPSNLRFPTHKLKSVAKRVDRARGGGSNPPEGI